MKGQEILPQTHKHTGGTVNRYLATLSHMFTFAMRGCRILDSNPVGDISKEPPTLANNSNWHLSLRRDRDLELSSRRKPPRSVAIK
jgi:hypothetical protein